MAGSNFESKTGTRACVGGLNRSRAATSLLLVVFALGAQASPARAQIAVTDVGAIAQLVLQVKRQIQQVTMQTSQLKAQLDNMKKLGSYNGRQIAVTLQQIDALTQQGVALWYSLGAIDLEFRRTFPGWQVSTAFAGELRLQQE